MSVIPRTKFCDVAYIKEVTPIQDNVDEQEIVTFIYIAQDVHIQKALGETFYNHLKTAGAANTLTDTEKDFLRNFVILPLAFWTYYEAYEQITSKVTNKGVQTESSEYSQPNDLDRIKYSRADIRNVAEYYDSILKTHLKNNSSTYPQYQNPDADENIRATSKIFFNGVYIPKSGTDIDPFYGCE